MNLERQRLSGTTQCFCNAFKNKADIDEILSFFASSDNISVIEHGEPALAPFLGKSFIGPTGIRAYFETVNGVLTYEDLQFSDFVIDVEVKKVGLKGRGVFRWKSTGECWSESFAYMLSFDEGYKIKKLQVWADSGSAYLARIGKLDEVRLVCDFQKRASSR